MSSDDTIRPSEERRAAVHRERAEAIEGLRTQIETLEAREPELRKEIAEFERAQRATIAELERNQRATISELEKTQRATVAALEQKLRTEPENADELEEELERTRTTLEDELERTRTELAENLDRTRTELGEELTRMRDEYAAIRPTVRDARCTLGMKMSDFALDENEGHEQAVEYLKPLLVELVKAHRHALLQAERDVAEAEEGLSALQAEHHDTAEAALPLVEQRFQPLIDAGVAAVSIEQAKVRVARHQLALVDPDAGDPDDDDIDPRLACELALEAAHDELDDARAKVEALQREKQAAVYHYSHPTAEKSKRLGGQLARRLARRRG
jgi:DNA repair exonuclease SbcCD ATPase subunit